MTTIKVMGNRDDTLKDVNFGTGLKGFEVADAVQFSSDRDASSVQTIARLKKDDVVELIFEGDIHRWVRVDELEQEYGSHVSRGDQPGVIEIPSRLPAKGTSRGAVSMALSAMRVIKFDPAKATARKLAEICDSKLSEVTGLFRYDQGLNMRGEEIKTKIKVKDNEPILLFIHGTFSTITGGYGKLPASTWTVLKQTYGEQIYGFDHKTLSVSPIENVIELIQKLPEKANLHIVTHSRGGLVGELLCRLNRKDSKHPFDEEDLKLFVEEKETAEQLTELSQLLKKKKKLKVERFVRVACPARGTTLASKRVDLYLELFVNVLNKVLPAEAFGPFGVLTDLLLELKKQSSNPEAMPGLASMVPDSNFIKMINRRNLDLSGDLSVIAGDVEKSGVLGTLKVFFADLFYKDDHDLVVNTPAMFGGPLRKDGRYFFHKGPNVTHVTYFANERTAQILQEALTLPLDTLKDKGFQPLVDPDAKAIPELETGKRSFQKRSNLTQPVVYVLPGIMGTHLADKGNRIWLDASALAKGGMDDLDIDNSNVQPQALMDFYYGRMVDYLSATHEVIQFPYDWRKSILIEAARFGRVVKEKFESTKPDQPIRIIAHSMGGLVTRAMIGLNQELWEKIQKRGGERIIMLGTPNAGSYMIPRVLFGQDITFRLLAMFDFNNPADELLKIIARFPGLLQLLPIQGKDKWNFVDAATWDRFPNVGSRKWTKPHRDDLKEVRNFHELLGRETNDYLKSLVYVAGQDRGAPVAVDIDNSGRIVFQATDRGDGTVPWESGILPSLLESDRVYYMRAKHGDMAKHKPSFGAIYDLLNEGKTTQLSRTPPTVRGDDVLYTLSEEEVQMYPSPEDLQAAVLGASLEIQQEQSIQPVMVSVVHGNLSFCSNPVAVGHYEGDELFSAEREMDHHLNGRLSVRQKLGLYPGPEGSVEVFLNEGDKKPRGAIIVGLGKAGELSPNKLTSSFANALREFGIQAVEHHLVGENGELKISTLLIGTGGTGLTITNSIDAILTAVLQANKSFEQIVDADLGDARQRYNVRIAEIQFIELFKDQAILAVRALEPFQNNLEFSIEAKLQSMQGGWKRVAYSPPPGWWNRLHIRADDARDEELVFSVPTDRARAEESRLGVQRRSLDRLVEQAVQNANWDQALATSLFELLIPKRIKGSFKDMHSVLFVVDREAARYPWELLYDRRSGRDVPLVIHAGMIRQFSTSDYEDRVVDAKNKNVMVIGNPKNIPENFADLPGAEQEATLVASKLKENGFDVLDAINSEPGFIMNHLFSKDYRVLHLAGHGVFEFEYRATESAKSEVYTGMVLGNGIFLTANEIEQQMNIPELVFINCCHLGKFSDPSTEDKSPKFAYNRFAASLSEQLIKMGVKAVIAAGWAVDDAAALTFAEVFYDQMLKGNRFGDAVKAARKETYDLHKDRTNTWGAYQCYGDPAYRLIISSDSDQVGSEKFVDVDEALTRVNQLYERAKTASSQGIGAVTDKLKQVSAEIEKNHPDWLKNARLMDALGEAFGEAFSFAEAVKYYALAVQSGKSTASIKAIEQRANFHIRLAVQEFESQRATYPASKRKIGKQIETLKQLTRTIGDTEERLCMIGGGYKRLAQIAGDTKAADCTSSLKLMEEYYRLAGELDDAGEKDGPAKKDKARKKGKSTYPFANELTATLVQLLRSGKPSEKKLMKFMKEIAEVRQKAEEDAAKAPDDFWAATAITNVKLLAQLSEYVGSGRQPMQVSAHDALVEEYKSAWRQYGSARELNSIIENFAFLIAVLKKAKTRQNPSAMLDNFYTALIAAYKEVN